MMRALKLFLGKLRMRPLAVISGGFALLILLGGILLSLPVAARDGRSIGLFDGLFTSTSAVCVTGLVVRDTGTSFSTFGQVVLLCLIEIGGLGFMTFAAMAFRLLGRGSSLKSRLLVQEAFNEPYLGGMDSLIRWVAKSAFSVQLAFALLLALRFVPQFGWGRGIFYSLFHAGSAFCNAGFDLLGGYASLTAYRADLLMNLTMMGLIICGGLGFGVLRDIRNCRRARFRLQTKLVLISYAVLLLLGWGFVLLAEWGNPDTLGAMPFGEKLLAALFQSVTLRTAGFNSISQAALRPVTKLISCVLMLIGAAPASTGGGIKITTAAIILLSVRSTAQGAQELVLFGRSIPSALVRRALAVALLALTLALVDVCAISIMQPELDFMDVLMECSSAMGTVGISAFGSARLIPASRILIMLTMYVGRIGPLSMALVIARRQRGAGAQLNYPSGQIMIG